jgi:hypothetical protein
MNSPRVYRRCGVLGTGRRNHNRRSQCSSSRAATYDHVLLVMRFSKDLRKSMIILRQSPLGTHVINLVVASGFIQMRKDRMTSHPVNPEERPGTTCFDFA